jgi:hypothetical protein
MQSFDKSDRDIVVPFAPPSNVLPVSRPLSQPLRGRTAHYFDKSPSRQSRKAA